MNLEVYNQCISCTREIIVPSDPYSKIIIKRIIDGWEEDQPPKKKRPLDEIDIYIPDKPPKPTGGEGGYEINIPK